MSAGKEHRDLVICNSCLWAASLLRGSKGFAACPVCHSTRLEIIPVEDYESYKIDVSKKRGIEIRFTRE